MEIFNWLNHLVTEALARNLASLGNDIEYNAIFMALYIFILVIKTTAARAKASAAVFICVGLSYSPLFYMLTDVQYYFMLSMIYVSTAKSITNKQASASCCIMAIFEIIMSLDSWRANGVETWIFVNYEMVTACIHCLILSSFLRGDLARWSRRVGSFINRLRSLLHSAGRDSFLWYYYSNSKHQQRR